MERKDFLKSACALGMCSCTAASIISSTAFSSSADEKKSEPDWRLGFIQRRFAKLIEGMDAAVDHDTKMKIIQNLGRSCAQENMASFSKFKGNPEGFLEELRRTYAEKTVYDTKTKTIKIIGKKEDACFCPFVNKAITPKDFCHCSIGFNTVSFEAVLEHPVDVTIDESVLRGGERCSFTIVLKEK